MKMCLSDAELVFDGRIPPDLIDNTLPARFTQANTVRLVNVREKPAATLGRMFRTIERLALAGAVTRGDIEAAGFTADEIDALAPAAFRSLRSVYPGLDAADGPL